MRFLITGFEPFGGYTQNVSWVVANEVASRGVSGAELFVESMPVSFARVGCSLHRAIERHMPDVVIMLGLGGESDCIRLERIAINMMDSAMADNDGYTPNEEWIYDTAPSALFCNLPIKMLCSAIREQKIPVKISNSCGLYVCNRVYFEALRLCNERAIKAIFLHLPLFEGQEQPQGNPKHTMPLADMTRAIVTIIDKITETTKIDDTNREI